MNIFVRDEKKVLTICCAVENSSTRIYIFYLCLAERERESDATVRTSYFHFSNFAISSIFRLFDPAVNTKLNKIRSQCPHIARKPEWSEFICFSLWFVRLLRTNAIDQFYSSHFDTNFSLAIRIVAPLHFYMQIDCHSNSAIHLSYFALRTTVFPASVSAAKYLQKKLRQNFSCIRVWK